VTSASLLEGRGESEVFFPEDGHWNARGHALVAEGLARWLRGRAPWQG
jgi:hypothetical protein